jgi:general secretion pathway protein H
VPVRWLALPEGFRFDGLPSQHPLPTRWLDPSTHVRGPGHLVLGPEPLIGPQQVILTQSGHPEHALRVATDGLRPFAVGAVQ